MTVGTYDAGSNGGRDAFVAKMNEFSPDRLRERFSSQTDATESLGRQTVTLEGGALSGALTGTISFFDLEMVSIQTGPFAGKGFYKGTWQATADGAQCSGTWQEMFFPDNAEGTIELRGTASGEISGLVEGSLRESTRGSGLFDQLRAILRLHTVAGQEVSGIVHLTGTALYGTTDEYPSTGLRLLQTSLEAEGAASFTDRLGVTLTQVLVADESNPYDGQGFSVLSYIADPGPGLGWTRDNQTFPGRVEMKGLFTGSLLGIAAITMDEPGPERTLLVRFERVGLSRATGPMPDLEVATWGPDRISPGLIIDFVDYIIFYCNRGATNAEGVFLVDRLPVEVGYVKSSEGGIYRPESHEVIWELGTLAPGEAGLLSVKCVMTRGLIENVNFNNQVMIGCTNPELDTVLFPEMTALTPWWNDAMIFYDGPLISWTPISSDTEGDVRNFPYIDVNVRDAIRLVDEVSGNEALELARLHMQGRINVDGNLDSQGLWNAKFELTELGYSEMYLSGGSAYDVQGVGVGEFLDQHQGLYQGLEGFSFRHIPESAPPALGTPEENLLWLAGILVHENTHRKQTMGEFYSGGEKGEIQAHQAQADFFFSYALKRAEEGDYDSAFTSLDLADETWGMLRERSTNASWPKDKEAAEIGKQSTATLRQLIEERRLLEATEEGKRFKETMDRLQEELPYDFSIRNNGDHMLSVLLAHDPNAKYGPEGSISAGQTLSYRVEFENEGEGIAYGVYFTDILDTDLDDSTLSIGPVLDVETGAEIAPPGIYDPRTRTITWFVGTVGPHMGGYADFSVNVRADAPDGTEVINYATVYFPSVPEETRTNGIVSIVGEEFPPVAVAGGPYEGAVGIPILFDAGGSYDEGTTAGISVYEWDWDGDGIFDETTSSPTVEHLWDTPYSGIVNLRIIDKGGLTDTDPASVEVVPRIPIARAGGPYDGTVGLPMVLDASGSENPDGGTIVSYEWDWDGDRIYDEATPHPVIEHTWVDEYSGLVRLKVADNDGLAGFGAAYVDVQGCTPTGVPESACNGADDDCDGAVDEDFVSSPTSCGVGVCAATGQSTCVNGQIGDTCQPGNPTGADDNCNGVDENCNGMADENFVSTQTSCGVGECSSTGVLVCADGLLVDSCLPGIPSEEVCEARDNNCNGEIDEGVLTAFYLDLDGDGYGDPDPAFRVEACEAPPAYVEDPTDCNDNDSFIHPGAEEVCKGVDDDCDGSVDEDFDQDSDGYTVCAGDCNDQDPAVHPGAAEVCADGQDNDCDGFVDAHDPDCVVGQPDLKGSLSRFPHVKRIKRGQWLVVGKLKIRNLGDADAGGRRQVLLLYIYPKAAPFPSP